MNIFLLDQIPELAAQQLCDQHLVKMPVEYCQMLACVRPDLIPKLPPTKKGTPYATPRHIKNHPATRWLAEDDLHINWLLRNVDEIFKIRKSRGAPRHACQEFIDAFKYYTWNPNQDTAFPAFRNLYCLGKYSVVNLMYPHIKSYDSIFAYRMYYLCDKLYWATFEGRHRRDMAPRVRIKTEYQFYFSKFMSKYKIPMSHIQLVVGNATQYTGDAFTVPIIELELDSTGKPTVTSCSPYQKKF